MNQQRISSAAKKYQGYRSRYQAFIKQRRSFKTDGNKRRIPGLRKGVVNTGIFIGLVLAILTLFGFGLTKFTSEQNTLHKNSSTLESAKSSITEGGLIVPASVYPSGHAVVQSGKSQQKVKAPTDKDKKKQ